MDFNMILIGTLAIALGIVSVVAYTKSLILKDLKDLNLRLLNDISTLKQRLESRNQEFNKNLNLLSATKNELDVAKTSLELANDALNRSIADNAKTEKELKELKTKQEEQKVQQKPVEVITTSKQPTQTEKKDIVKELTDKGNVAPVVKPKKSYKKNTPKL